ncbi:MAG: hypothetical protein ACR2QE_16745 [Acidimicrobiales bacterium]
MFGRVVLFVVVALGGLAPGGVSAGARCACDDLTDPDLFEQATYVFEARAIAPVELVIPDGSRPADGWSFVVTGVAKGQVGPEQLVAVPDDDCAPVFDREATYLIFADDRRADLPAAVVYTDVCAGTRLATEPFDGDISFRTPEPIPIDTDAFPVVADPLEQRAIGDKLTTRAVIAFVVIIGGTAALAAWLWRTRPSRP